VGVNGASPFRTTAVERYARTRPAPVTAGQPTRALLVTLWLVLILALAAGGVWLAVAWRYLAS
jgi:hypothetical protein